MRWLCEPCARWEPCWELRVPLELYDAEVDARCELLESYASLPALRVDDALRALRGCDEALRFCEAMVATVAGAPEKPLLMTGTLTNLRLAGADCRLGESIVSLASASWRRSLVQTGAVRGGELGWAAAHRRDGLAWHWTGTRLCVGLVAGAVCYAAAGCGSRQYLHAVISLPCARPVALSGIPATGPRRNSLPCAHPVARRPDMSLVWVGLLCISLVCDCVVASYRGVYADSGRVAAHSARVRPESRSGRGYPCLHSYRSRM